MRSKALGINAPVFSPPNSTPHGLNPRLSGWGGASTPGVPDFLGDASLPSVLGVDVWGSNIDRIRRLEDAAPATLPAASTLSVGGMAGDTSAQAAVAGAPTGVRDSSVPLPGDAGQAVVDAGSGGSYLLLNSSTAERSVEHLQRLELENAVLRRHLASAEEQLTQLRAAVQQQAQHREETSVVVHHTIGGGEAEEAAAQGHGQI
jgi:hypothetical protein